jgi:putative two-component system response regulator
MRGHTIVGEQICVPMRTLAPVLPIIRSHHERWDGSGYPDGLAGERIPLLARVLQIVDIYDALTTVRPYKRAYSHEEAIEKLEEEVRLGWRDPELVSLFERIFSALEPPPAVRNESASLPWSEVGAMQVSLENMGRRLLD